jgi:hypothetical protein
VNKLSSSLWTSYLSYDVCFVSEDMFVDCSCMSKWKQWEMDRVDLSMRTDSKETMINKPPSHLFTDAALPLHDSWVLIINRRQMLIGNRFYSTLSVRRISNGLKQPVTDRALISTGLYYFITDRFDLCNGLYLTSVTKNSCNGRLRSPLPEVNIGNGRCGGQPRGRPGALIGNGRQTTTVTDIGGCNGR